MPTRHSSMKLVLVFLMIFFGTLLAAALVALGEPQDTGALPAALQAVQVAAATP